MQLRDDADFYDIISTRSCFETKFNALHELSEQLGFTDIFYGRYIKEQIQNKRQLSNIRTFRAGCPKWESIYQNERYAGIDWAVEKALWAKRMYRLDDVPGNLTDTQQRFVNHASEYKRQNGFCLPFRSSLGLSGGFSATGAKHRPCIRKIAQLAAAAQLFDLEVRLSRVDITASGFGLTHREQELIQLLSTGRSMVQIAHLQGKSEQWIRVSFLQIREKFKVGSNAEVIYKATSLGLI